MTRRSMRSVRSFLAVGLLLFGLGIDSANGSVVSDIFGANVTTTSITVAWWADEPATGTVEVFLDPDAFLNVTSFLSLTNLADGNAAERGMMAVRIDGLAPATEYFVRTTTTPTGGGGATIEPATTPLLGIQTASQTERVATDLSLIANDLLTLGIVESDTTTPAMGSLAVVIIDGAARPIVGFVGVGIAAPLTLLDLNNLYGVGPGVSLPISGGEILSQIGLGGFSGAGLSGSLLPIPSGLSAPVSAGPALVLGSLLPDTDVDGISDPLDNCPTTSNGFRPGQRGPDGGIQVDQDADGLGDACDPTPVPEPSLAAMLTAGVGMFLLAERCRASRRRRRH